MAIDTSSSVFLSPAAFIVAMARCAAANWSWMLCWIMASTSSERSEKLE